MNLLGLDWIEQLKLFDIPLKSVFNTLSITSVTEIERYFTNELKNKFSNVFQEGLGCCTKSKVVLKLNKDAKPIFRPKRPVPYAALEMVEKELLRLQQQGVIQPTNYSKWAAPIVVVRKANGKIRICADYSTGLNNSLESHQYPLPIPEDLFTKLNGGIFFAKIDFSDAFLQLEVEEESRELLTINTHKGLFRFNRLSFGVKPAPAIFQQTMDAMLTGLTGVAAFIDDIIVTAASQDELLQRLFSVFSRIEEHGFRVKAEKCEFFRDKIKYLGFIIDKYGRKPDPENTKAIENMQAPVNIKTLRSFLGLVSHYSAFLPELHRVRAPLNSLLKKDTTWDWSDACQSAFTKVKTLLSSNLLLTHYDPSMDIVVVSDASNYGVGAVISHVFPDSSQKAIAHASRSLTPAERNYSQIEKEALAIVFAIKKFHKMLYGRHFTLITDHKPLLSIFGSKKGIPVYTANRLQRWATTLLDYNFTIKYNRTDTIGHADALSRLMTVQNKVPEDSVIAAVSLEPEITSVFASTVRALPVTSTMIREATASDPVLQIVKRFHRTKWPKVCTDKRIQPFFQRRASLSEVDECFLFAERVIVPSSLQDRVLKQFHYGHQGISRMKALARSYAYWPNMDKQLEELAHTCSNCQLAAKSPRKTTLSSWPIPESPWLRLHIDFAGPLNGQYYFILVDAYSKWPEIFQMNRITSDETIQKLKQIFSRFGTPQILVSDNGTAFTSGTFANFCALNGIQHIKTPPFHPQSNGQVERFVDTFKRALIKNKGEGTTQEILEIFLSSYRATPNPNTPNGNSPAEALMNRKVRLHIDVIHPAPQHSQKRNMMMEEQFNQHHGAVKRTYVPGQSVLAKDYRRGKERWIQGRIIRRSGNVIYDVDIESTVWVRHANQLRSSHLPETRSDFTLPLDILLDTFELPPQRSQDIPKDNPKTPNKCVLRKSYRFRRKPYQLQIDSRNKSYELKAK